MTVEMNAALKNWIRSVEAASHQLAEDRQRLLSDAAQQTAGLVMVAGEANLLFVCTHNSRRSQFSQVWAEVASRYYRADRVHCHSCGTETTACNPRTVASLVRSGFQVSTDSKSENPHYRCVFDDASIELFSKAFGHDSLPSRAIVALMCCDDADEKCPVVPGAEFRVPLHYEDPKKSDGSGAEEKTYDERSQQIAAEMFFLVRQLASHA